MGEAWSAVFVVALPTTRSALSPGQTQKTGKL